MIIAFYLFYKHTLLYQWESGRLVNKFFETIGKLGGKWANSDPFFNQCIKINFIWIKNVNVNICVCVCLNVCAYTHSIYSRKWWNFARSRTVKKKV